MRNNPHKSLLLSWPILSSFTRRVFLPTLLVTAYYNYLIRSVTSCSEEGKGETLFSKLKSCFEECWFHLGGGLHYSQLEWNPKVISLQNFGSRHLSTPESSCKINSHFHASAFSGFSWARKVKDCFCAFSSLTDWGGAVCAFGKLIQSKPVSRAVPGAPPASSVRRASTFLPYALGHCCGSHL